MDISPWGRLCSPAPKRSRRASGDAPYHPAQNAADGSRVCIVEGCLPFACAFHPGKRLSQRFNARENARVPRCEALCGLATVLGARALLNFDGRMPTRTLGSARSPERDRECRNRSAWFVELQDRRNPCINLPLWGGCGHLYVDGLLHSYSCTQVVPVLFDKTLPAFYA